MPDVRSLQLSLQVDVSCNKLTSRGIAPIATCRANIVVSMSSVVFAHLPQSSIFWKSFSRLAGVVTSRKSHDAYKTWCTLSDLFSSWVNLRREGRLIEAPFTIQWYPMLSGLKGNSTQVKFCSQCPDLRVFKAALKALDDFSSCNMLESKPGKFLLVTASVSKIPRKRHEAEHVHTYNILLSYLTTYKYL